jgi:hypothetical protein
MSGVRPSVYANEVMERMIAPGDILLLGESILSGAIATAGAGTWTGAAIATGCINRTGPVGGYTDTTDTAANILLALQGNSPASEVMIGSTFRLLVRNTVAQALTFAAGTGVKTGTGTLNIANSLVREYLLTVLNASPLQSFACTGTTASAVVTFVLPPNATALPMAGSNGNVGVCSVTPGMTVTDTTTSGNITAGTTVIGVGQGPGGIINVTLSAVPASNFAAAGDILQFSPTIQIDSFGTMGL